MKDLREVKKEKFRRQLQGFHLELSKRQLRQFDRYQELLEEWNKVMNLTGITEYEEVNEKHFLDSLSIVKTADMAEISSVIDIGTGAGFPGIPLKIAFPHLKLTLLDSLKKRIGFLDTVIREIGLKDTETIHGRAEDFARKKGYREAYDLSVSRAVARLSVLAEYCIPYIRVGGIFISYKSGQIEEELHGSETAVRKLGGKTEDVTRFVLPETEINRSLVKIRKIKETPEKYPRKAGMPEKEPL